MKKGSIIFVILIVMTTITTALLSLLKTCSYGNLLSVEREIYQKIP